MCALSFWVTIGSTSLWVLKWFLLGLGKFWVLLRHICLPVPSIELQCLQLWWLVFPWCPSCRQVTGLEFPLQPDIIFILTSLLQIDTRIPFDMFSWVSVSSHLVARCETLTFIKSCKYIGLSGHSSLQYLANSFPNVCAVLTLDIWNYYSEEQDLTAQHPFLSLCHRATYMPASPQPEWLAAAGKHQFMFACPSFNSKARNKSHDLTVCILMDIYEDILEYYVEVRIII